MSLQASQTHYSSPLQTTLQEHFNASLSHKTSNFDFKLCRSQKDGHKLRQKVDSSNGDAKIVQIEVARGTRWPGKGKNELSFFVLEKKFAKKTASRYKSFKTAPSICDFVKRKLLQTLKKNPKPMK